MLKTKVKLTPHRRANGNDVCVQPHLTLLSHGSFCLVETREALVCGLQC